MTIVARDVAEALDGAWRAFQQASRGGGRDWDMTSASAEVLPEGTFPAVAPPPVSDTVEPATVAQKRSQWNIENGLEFRTLRSCESGRRAKMSATGRLRTPVNVKGSGL
jgi:hypothetical protein